MLTTSTIPVNVLSLRLRYAVTYHVQKLVLLDVPCIRDLSSVPLIARTRAQYFTENLGQLPTIDLPLFSRRTSVYIYNPVNRAALCILRRICRARTCSLVSPRLPVL